MVDGSIESVDHELTENNRAFARSFVEAILIDRQLDTLTNYVDEQTFVEHNPRLADGVSTLRSALEAEDEGHRLLKALAIIFAPSPPSAVPTIAKDEVVERRKSGL